MEACARCGLPPSPPPPPPEPPRLAAPLDLCLSVCVGWGVVWDEIRGASRHLILMYQNPGRCERAPDQASGAPLKGVPHWMTPFDLALAGAPRSTLPIPCPGQPWPSTHQLPPPIGKRPPAAVNFREANRERPWPQRAHIWSRGA